MIPIFERQMLKMLLPSSSRLRNILMQEAYVKKKNNCGVDERSSPQIVPTTGFSQSKSHMGRFYKGNSKAVSAKS